jgi:hypothetical protein
LQEEKVPMIATGTAIAGIKVDLKSCRINDQETSKNASISIYTLLIDASEVLELYGMM